MGFKVQKGPGGHGEVQHRLHNCGDLEVMRVGSQLDELRVKRNKADYNMADKSVENQATAKACVEQSERMLTILDRCRQEPKRSQIVSGIKEYEQKITHPRE
ncbi:MAG: hypothetical protein MCM46_12210 [Candidatus Manganitrophus sp. SB1]|nr:hypothetical protein [Candidatus Manganitrophus morganii]